MGSEEIEAVRGRVGDDLASELLTFWEQAAGFTGAPARARLSEVVAVVRHHGVLAGVASVFAGEMPQVTGMRLWILRALLPGAATDHRPALISQVFATLDAEYDEAPESPSGLCVLADAAEARARPEAIWEDPPMIYAGYLEDGRQIRIGYFEDDLARRTRAKRAAVATRAEPYRFRVFAEQDEVAADDIVALWRSELTMSREEAELRVAQLVTVALDARGRPVGVCTAFRRYNAQLRADLWHMRLFVAAAHRRSQVANVLSA